MKSLFKLQKIYIYFFLGTSMLLGFVNARSQQSVSAATLSGTVTDINGAVIAGARIASKNLGTNQTYSAVSGSDGRFRFSYLPVGNYELTTDAAGFETKHQNISVTIGQALEINTVLNTSGITATVDIADGEPLIDTGRTQIAETIFPNDIDSLPLNGRNFVDLALLVPGVSRTNTGSVQRFAETSAVPGTGISVAGQRNLNNSFIVDGLSANDDSVELAGTFYGQDVIREFQVITNGASAEFGRASSGFINIVTKSGTNAFAGSLYSFLRNQQFDARNPLAASKDPLTQVQYGGSFGGPIIKGRTFFFSNFEQTRRHDSSIITISPANITAINNRLKAVGYKGSTIETGLAPGGYDTTNLFGRLDHQIDKSNAFSLTYNFYDINAQNARNVGGLNAISRGTDLTDRDHTIAAQNITTIGFRSLNELRFQYRRSLLSAPPADLVGPAVNISGIVNFGTATFSPTERDIDLYQLSDSFNTTVGKHSLKAGAEFLYNDLNIAFPGAVQGVYSFSNLANFLSGNYVQFQQAFGEQSQRQKNPNFGLFAEDEWRVRRNLTFNLGFRYDLQFLPRPIITDTDNISPRVGFAYSPDSRTVIRGSFGIFYDRIPTRATSNALQRDGSKYRVVLLTPITAGAPVFPAVLLTEPTDLKTRPNVTTIDPAIQNSSTEQASLQVEREMPWNSRMSVGYMFLRGLHLILSRNINVPQCSTAVDTNLCRPDPSFGNISRYEGSGNSYYNGLVVSFNKSEGNWANFRLSYTFSKAIDNAGNFFFSTPQDNADLRDERGLSDNDQRHRLTLSGTFTAPKHSFGGRALNGFQLGYIFTYASSLPFNIVTGNDRNGDTNNNDRPVGIGRNTGRGFDYSSLDLRLSRKFELTERLKFEILAEGFNVLNHANYSVPNNTFGTGAAALPSFGRPTAAFDPRQIQLGLRLDF